MSQLFGILAFEVLERAEVLDKSGLLFIAPNNSPSVIHKMACMPNEATRNSQSNDAGNSRGTSLTSGSNNITAVTAKKYVPIAALEETHMSVFSISAFLTLAANVMLTIELIIMIKYSLVR